MPDAAAIRAALARAGIPGIRVGPQSHLGLVARVPQHGVPDALRELKSRAGRSVLVDLFGCDTGESVELTYHLRWMELDEDLFLKAEVPYGGWLSSVWETHPGALYPEREIAEMFGVALRGHPNPKRLLTSEDSPPTPLRRSARIRTDEGVHDRDR